jgi:hypothetical protein
MCLLLFHSCVCADDGSVYIYDLLTVKDIIRPALILDASPVGGPVYAQAFNARRPEMFATGDATSIQVRLVEKGESEVERGRSEADARVQLLLGNLWSRLTCSNTAANQ